MIWLIIFILAVIWGIYSIIKGDKFALIPVIICPIIIWGLIFSYLDYIKQYEIAKLYPKLIENKIITIKKMKETYYKPNSNLKINIDMVNKDLAKQINNEIKSLNSFINNYNKNIITWKMKYQYRLWTTCWKKPPKLKIINLGDYNF